MGYGMSAGRIVAGCLLVLAGATAGCQSSVPLLGRGEKRREIELELQESLRFQLELFARQFSAKFQEVVNEIQSVEPGPEIQRRILSERLEVVPTFRALLRHPDARIVYLDMAAYCAQLERRLTSDQYDLGRGQDLAEDAAKDLSKRIHDIGATFLDPEQLAEVHRDVQQFADEQPLGQQFSTFYAQGGTGLRPGSTITSIITAPLSALNPFGGIDATAVAIHDASEMGERFADVVEQLPDVLRWQVQLVLHNLRTSPEVASIVGSIDEITATVASLEETTRTLPEDVRTQVVEILAETEATQASLRETMAEARTTLEELNGTLERVEPVMLSIERTTTGLAEAGAAWEGAVRAVQELITPFIGDPDAPEEEPAADEDSGEPFRILDYAETAEQLAVAAAELRVLLSDVRGVITGDDLDLVTGAVKDTANAAVDHIVFRIGELILVILAAGIAGRAFWSRARPAPDADPLS